jgi:hypothetical protein
MQEAQDLSNIHEHWSKQGLAPIHGYSRSWQYPAAKCDSFIEMINKQVFIGKWREWNSWNRTHAIQVKQLDPAFA